MARTIEGVGAAGAIDWTTVRAERLAYPSGAAVFSQGDEASTVIFIDRGGVRLSVLSYSGKEAVVALVERGDFFGENCLAGQTTRVATATTMGDTEVLVITRQELIRQLHSSAEFADRFIAHMLKRNQRIERDLIDQLFNNSEKRLARTLLLLAQYGQDGATPRKIPKVSQSILAEMIGTTRTRVNLFMTRFRHLGYIEYKGGGDLTVNQSLLAFLLRQ